MPSAKTIGKAVSAEQYEAFTVAAQAAGLERSAAIDKALADFCKNQGVEWPKTAQHGGNRKMTAILHIQAPKLGINEDVEVRWIKYRDLNYNTSSHEADVTVNGNDVEYLLHVAQREDEIAFDVQKIVNGELVPGPSKKLFKIESK